MHNLSPLNVLHHGIHTSVFLPNSLLIREKQLNLAKIFLLLTTKPYTFGHLPNQVRNGFLAYNHFIVIQTNGIINDYTTTKHDKGCIF